MISTATAIAATWPLLRAAGRWESSQLVGEARGANLAEAAVDYHLATKLDPANHAGYLGLARNQIAAGQANLALSSLANAGEGSDATRLRVRTLLELNRRSAAADQASNLTQPGSSDADIELSALADALAGRTDAITPLITAVSSPEAAQHVRRAQTGNLPLAVELYASGLPESSRTLLVSLPTSYERNLLLARIYTTRHSPTDLATATDYLSEAVRLNPSDIEAHQLLAELFTDQGQTAASANQSALIKQLQTGRP